MTAMSRLYGAVTLSFLLVVGLQALVSARDPAPSASSDAARFFETRIRPLFAENCLSCHGETIQQSGLRLDTRAGFLRGAAGGPLVTPDAPEQSPLLRAVRHEGAIQMPPGGKLKPEQIADLTRWVAMGAPWPDDRTASEAGESRSFPYPAASRKFWSFLPVKNRPVPPVKNRAWVKSPLDAFILAGLEKKGLHPAPPADKRTLLRRATFDLTGLPPTPGEISAFLADRSPDAFRRVVDRLLASPRYGERWGRHWLDVVRYTDSLDTRGLGDGDISEAWRYRDWVVDAFNRDLPYDQFILNQIAGDLLPAPGGDEINVPGTIATGMLAIGEWGNGDADKEKILTDIADDQVDVVSRGFMGLTVSCARCHDHKFDPIPTADYYGMAGIFFSTHILPRLTPKGAGETPLRIPLVTKAEREQRERWQARVTDLEQRRKTAGDTYRAALAREMLPQTARYVEAVWRYTQRPAEQVKLSPAEWATKHDLHPYALRQWLSHLGLGDYRLMTIPLPNVLGTAGVHAWKNDADTPSLVANTNADARTILTFTLPPRSVAVHPGPASGVAVGWKSPITGTVRVSGRVVDADAAGGDGIVWALDHRTSAGVSELAAGEFANGGEQSFSHGVNTHGVNTHGVNGSRLDAVSVRAGETLQLLVLPKQAHTCDTTLVELTITEADGKRVWNLARDIIDDLHQDGKGNPHGDRYGHPGVWRFYDLAGSSRITPAADPNQPVARWRRAVAASPSLDAIAAASTEFARTFDLADARSPFWISETADETALPNEARAALAKIDHEWETLRRQTPPPIAYAHGAQEGGCPESPHAGIHDVRIHLRGSYARLGDLVPRHFPVVLAGERQAPIPPNRSGRLELARWLASPTHPLTARVLVNRLWQHHFGQGIVRTPNNFGLLGERPTHPELLDWLAMQFVRGGWSIKKMHRLMMLSATYQQSSDAPPRTVASDPDNRLWGRMNRRRLEAEAVRDNLLAVAGKLDTTAGGPATRDFNSARRTLYLMTIRSDRTGFGPLFDAANPAASVERRTISNVAPQALFLLNNPFVLDQARALARRVQREAPGDDKARIRHAYLLLYGRPVKAEEAAVGLQFLGQTRRAAGTPTAPWEQYCQVLLCANEFIYVD